ncbi:hypothetical protein IAQ61_005435 [Plenodomus lingam]|uniref:uncharacterized protein n=1 Tax=Leptosphaeria maculans TaxID=5022 RepID=UPI00332C4DDF|nr:hypothetical protein IAQ61_005435 [Plenodomus lingam]
MPPKRKAQDIDTAPKRCGKKSRATIKKDEVYSAQQKAAITQFINFTQLDRNTAIRALKSNGWDAQAAVNA